MNLTREGMNESDSRRNEWIWLALELRLSLYSGRDKGCPLFASHNESSPKSVRG